MELHQLRYFLAVVDEGSFTAAAVAVRISQSGISTQIQKLERELGFALVDRSARRVSLTPAGSQLVPYVRVALAAVDDVSAAAYDVRGLVVGSLRVGVVTGLAWPPLFDALSAMHADHPGVDIRLQEGNSEDLIAQVREGVVDVAIAAWAGADPEGLRSSVAVDDHLVAVVGTEHRWARRARLRIDEVAGADLITLPKGTGARAALEAVLTRAGMSVAPRWDVATPEYVRMLTARGLGVGIVSATTAQGWDDVVPLRISDDLARSRLGVLWRPGPGHAARALLRELLPKRAAEGFGE